MTSYFHVTVQILLFHSPRVKMDLINIMFHAFYWYIQLNYGMSSRYLVHIYMVQMSASKRCILYSTAVYLWVFKLFQVYCPAKRFLKHVLTLFIPLHFYGICIECYPTVTKAEPQEKIWLMWASPRKVVLATWTHKFQFFKDNNL